MSRIYHDGSRQLQDRFDTRRLADRLEQRTLRDAFTDEDRAFIAALPMFFLATADEQGHPQCSYKGGEPGFVRVIDERTLAFPSFDGNGMYLSMGNVLHNAQVGMLFIDFEKQQRLRVNGLATIDERDPLMAQCPEAQFVVRVRATEISPNCRVTFIGYSCWTIAVRTGGRARNSDPQLEAACLVARVLPAGDPARKANPSTKRPLTKKAPRTATRRASARALSEPRSARALVANSHPTQADETFPPFAVHPVNCPPQGHFIAPPIDRPTRLRSHLGLLADRALRGRCDRDARAIGAASTAAHARGPRRGPAHSATRRTGNTRSRCSDARGPARKRRKPATPGSRSPR